MDTFFILISPDKEQGVDTLYGIYTELQMLHSKVLEIMATKQDNIEKLMELKEKRYEFLTEITVNIDGTVGKTVMHKVKELNRKVK